MKLAGYSDAIGAKVVIHMASGTQTQEVQVGTGYLSQGPPTLHFGLGRERTVSEVEVHWPGTGRRVSRLQNVRADRRITVRQPEPDGILLQVVEGVGSGLHKAGSTATIEANAPGNHYSFSHWVSERGGRFADVRSARSTLTMPDRPVTVFARFLPGPAPSGSAVSVARRWMEVLLQAIRDDLARPTVHARNLFHLSAAMYDAWASYDDAAKPWAFGDAALPCPPPEQSSDGDIGDARQEAISHAAWLIIRHRFRASPNAADTTRNSDKLLSELGYGSGASAGHGRPAAELGRCIGKFYIERGLKDGSNEVNDYASTAYEPVNPDLAPGRPGNPGLDDPDRWQPLWLHRFIDQSGVLATDRAEFVTPEWGRVTPFSLVRDDLAIHRRDGVDYHVHHDPGPPPLFADAGSKLYKWGFALVARWSAQLSPEDGVWIDIAPSGIGNLRTCPERFGDCPTLYDGPVQGPGHAANPSTGKSYAPQLVPRGDYARVLAEFWADGPDSETPPGHWFVILNAVSDDEPFTRRFEGGGPFLDELEWDVKAYFALGGAMHDAAVTAWGIKGWYDSIRPISALRWMGGRGQSSDPALPSWSPDGLPLVPGAIELVGRTDPLAGERGEHVDKVKLRVWRGPDHIDRPAIDAAGVGWILAENWWPYQRPTFVTPPFAGYVSGHSTFSSTAAEVLTALTGDPFFPGGVSNFPVRANDFLAFERRPSVDMTLQWATYRDAADQCSLSRIWGGIHPPADDIPGRRIGRKIGVQAFRLARSYFDAAAERRTDHPSEGRRL